MELVTWLLSYRVCVIHWYSGIPLGVRGTLEATLEAVTFIMLLAFSPPLTDEAPTHKRTSVARKKK